MARTGDAGAGAEAVTIRALHVVPSLVGGAPRGAIELVRELRTSCGVDAMLCVLGDAAGEADVSGLEPLPEFLGCPVHVRASAWRRWKLLRAAIRRVRPGVVHSHLWPAAANVARAGAGLAFAHVVHVRDTPPAFAQDGPRNAAKKALLRAQLAARPTTYMAVSEATRDYTVRHLGIDARRIRVVLNGIDVARFEGAARAPRRAGTFVVGAAGRLVREKGHELLIRAVAEMLRGGRAVRLRIAGEGSLRAELARLATELGVGERVEFVGHVADMAGFYADLDVFALPSMSSEGLPRAVLEAMASGCPVVASDCAGVREVVPSSDEGIVVPVGDAAALGKALASLADQPGLRAELAERGRRRVIAEFAASRVAREVAAAYREVLGQKN